MSAPWRVDVTVGSYSLTTQEDTAAGYGLAEPLTIKESLPNVDTAPLCQRDPDEATFSVIAANASSYRFNLGDQVRVAIYSDHSGSSPRVFYGRVAQLTAQPHDLGILYTLQCVDYTADLTELKAGRVDYPQESSRTRINRMLAENGIGPVGYFGVSPANDPQVVARTAATEGSIGLMDAIEDVLAGWTESQPNNELGTPSTNTITCRYELRPNITSGTLNPDVPFALTPIYRPSGWDPPLRLTASAPYKLTASVASSSPATDALVLDAGHVEFAPLFTQQKGNLITRVVVAFPGVLGYTIADWASWGTYLWAAASAALEAQVKVILASNAFGPVLASMYRGPIQPDSGRAWVVGELQWLASRTQAAGWVGPKLRRVCTVARVDAARPSSHIPTGKAWITGVVDSVRTTVQAGEVTVGFTLAPMHYTNTGALVVPHQATFAAASLSGVTFAQLDTTDTFGDYLSLYA